MKLDDLNAGLDRIEKLLAKPIARTATSAPARRSKKKGAK